LGSLDNLSRAGKADFDNRSSALRFFCDAFPV